MSLVGIKVGVMVCDLNWATGDFERWRNLAPLVTFAAGMPGKFGFFFFFVIRRRINTRLGLPNGLFSLPV